MRIAYSLTVDGVLTVRAEGKQPESISVRGLTEDEIVDRVKWALITVDAYPGRDQLEAALGEVLARRLREVKT